MIWHSIGGIPLTQFAAFVGGALVVNFTPGQDIFFATASGVQGGPKVGAMAGFGVGLGALWHVALSALGLSTLIAAHPGWLLSIKYTGACYLLYLAWKSWRDTAEITAGKGARTGWSAFRRGAFTNMLSFMPVKVVM